jgi:soluble lytic murein transglycosylase-like protein
VQERWANPDFPLDPLLFKALVAVESAFDPAAVSPAGAAGLVQLMPGTALRHGLSLSPVDERLIPEKALPVGVAVLAEKHYVITHPEEFALLEEEPGGSPWGEKVARAYRQYGMPSGDALWRLTLGAYNGGGGTVLRAMARAYDQGLDPRLWSNLIEPLDRPTRSPLYQAVREVYGDEQAARKYREMSRYPGRILALRDRGRGRSSG